jgi:hypothetical protein
MSLPQTLTEWISNPARREMIRTMDPDLLFQMDAQGHWDPLASVCGEVLCPTMAPHIEEADLPRVLWTPLATGTTVLEPTDSERVAACVDVVLLELQKDVVKLGMAEVIRTIIEARKVVGEIPKWIWREAIVSLGFPDIDSDRVDKWCQSPLVLYRVYSNFTSDELKDLCLALKEEGPTERALSSFRERRPVSVNHTKARLIMRLMSIFVEVYLQPSMFIPQSPLRPRPGAHPGPSS